MKFAHFSPSSTVKRALVLTPHTHYEALGVSKTADSAEIRDAYRRSVREVHPDSSKRASADASARMAEISQAWMVLSDPERRRDYNATLLEQYEVIDRARFPWRFVLIITVIGIAIMFGINAASHPSQPSGPDGLLQSGSCVVVDGNLTAVEVSCESPHDGVVRQLIGFDMTCPGDTEAIRDRQGMGVACVVRN